MVMGVPTLNKKKLAEMIRAAKWEHDRDSLMRAFDAAPGSGRFSGMNLDSKFAF